MERKELTPIQILELKKSTASLVFDNIETPGWIELYNPNARKLSLQDVDPLALARKLDGPISLIRRNLSLVIPEYEKRFQSLKAQTDEEELGEDITFSAEDATILAVLISHLNGTTIEFYGGGSFTFTVEPWIQNVCQHLIGQAPRRENLTSEQLIARRQRVITKVSGFLKMDDQPFNEFLEQQEKDIENLFTWLYFEDLEKSQEVRPGFIFEFLSMRYGAIWQARKGEVERVQRIVKFPGSLRAQIGTQLEQINGDQGLEVAGDVTDSEIQTIPEEDTLAQGAVRPDFIETYPPEKPKISALERRDLQIHQTIDSYLNEIEAVNITAPITTNRLSREFNKLTITVVNRMIEKRYVRPESGRDGHPQYNTEEIALMLYIAYHTNTGFTPTLVKELSKIVRERIALREKQTPQRNNNHQE